MNAAIELSKLPIIERIQELKARIDELRPLDKETEARIFQKFRLDWNFHSNAIEGNTLDYGETVAFLMHGVTAKGKPFKDYIDLKGHDIAINYVTDLIKDENIISEKEIRALHEIILQEPYEVDTVSPSGLPSRKLIQLGRYKTSPNHVKTATGEIHYYATPEETPAKMQELMEWYNRAVANPEIHPVVLAALFHHKFVAIHPFDDGNGRLARILMNLIIMKNGYPPIIIKQEKAARTNYYMALSQADVNDFLPFIELVTEQQIASLSIYLKGALGERIEEPDDLDKEIALLKTELKGENILTAMANPETICEAIEQNIIPLFILMEEKCKELNEFFFDNDRRIEFEVNDMNPTVRMVGTKETSWDEIISQWLKNQIRDQQKQLQSIRYRYELSGFRKTKEANSFSLNVYVDFSKYNYQISGENPPIPYKKKLSQIDLLSYITPLVKRVINGMKELNENNK